MPLVVPILRLVMLFLNVYESFKTLKAPTRSARSGQPTVRAVSQRKRDMKGCLAVWVVWVRDHINDNNVQILNFLRWVSVVSPCTNEWWRALLAFSSRFTANSSHWFFFFSY